MHAFAAAAARARNPDRKTPSLVERWRGVYAGAMVRCFSDCGMRIGEVLPLRRTDLVDGVFQIRRTAHDCVTMSGTKTDHGEPDAGRDVPCPPTLLALIAALPPRIDTVLLFPTPKGKLWRERNFYRDV
jgi:integrase